MNFYIAQVIQKQPDRGLYPSARVFGWAIVCDDLIATAARLPPEYEFD